jgi:hypothetical protein
MSDGERGGPYLQVAVLCEKVLQEATGTLSAIRIVDRVTATAQSQGAPETMPPVNISLTALIVFRSGDAKGTYAVTLQPVFPSGLKPQYISAPILLEGEDRGAHLIFDLNFQAREEGLYWFDVSIKGELVTRIPLRVLYQRVVMSQSGGTPIH